MVSYAKAWLKQHAASERSFGRALRRFFSEQAARVAQQAADVHGLTPDHVPLIFNPDAEHALLMPLVRRNLAGLMVAGAESQLLDSKAFDPYNPEFMERFGLDAYDLVNLFNEALPAPVKDAIRNAINESSSQPYWRRIQDGVSADIAKIIQTGIDEGVAATTTARRIAEQLGGDDAKRRSRTIARSETTMALNAGHQASLDGLADDPRVQGKEWLSIGDQDTRQTHMELNSVIVPVRASFNVGGYEAPYPGHWSLPAQERANCRCAVVSVIAE